MPNRYFWALGLVSKPATLTLLHSGKSDTQFQYQNLELSCQTEFESIELRKVEENKIKNMNVCMLGEVLFNPFYVWLFCRFKVVADAVVGTFSLLSLIFVYAFTRSKWNTKYYFYIFLHDLVSKLCIFLIICFMQHFSVLSEEGKNRN